MSEKHEHDWRAVHWVPSTVVSEGRHLIQTKPKLIIACWCGAYKIIEAFEVEEAKPE